MEQLSAEFLATGRFTQETVDRLFEDAWKQGVIEDREFYDTYKPVKDFLRTTAVTIRETDSHDIVDYLKIYCSMMKKSCTGSKADLCRTLIVWALYGELLENRVKFYFLSLAGL